MLGVNADWRIGWKARPLFRIRYGSEDDVRLVEAASSAVTNALGTTRFTLALILQERRKP